MSVIQIIVPVTPDKLHLLADCLESIKKHTPVDHVVNVVVGNARLEDKVGEAVAVARGIYNRAGLIISCADPDHGYNGMVFDALIASDFPYTVACPTSHRIMDREWFGKMQLPQIRAPSCGMTFAPDNQVANTIASNPWDWRHPVSSKFFMVSRNVIGTLRNAHVNLDGEDIAQELRDALRAVGSNTWIVPSCRIEQMHAEW